MQCLYRKFVHLDNRHFFNYEHDFDFIMNIINGMRPKVVPGTSLEYKFLMEIQRRINKPKVICVYDPIVFFIDLQ